jgi:hypothetical protein
MRIGIRQGTWNLMENTNDEIWVSTSEAADLTGYDQQYLQKLALKLTRQPEAERLIRLRNRTRRYEFWLPDLIGYMENIGRGPHAPKPTSDE